MSRFGRGRVPGCECESNRTCGACLRAAPPWHYTLSDGSAIAMIPFQGRRVDNVESSQDTTKQEEA